MNYSSSRTEVYYRNRKTQEMIAETNLDENILRWFYENSLGFMVFQSILNNPLFCWLYGQYKKSSLTRHKIAAFVDKHQINSEEVELSLEEYTSFNAFFCRRLKPKARPFTEAVDVFCSPADGKVLVYSQLTPDTCMNIKGVNMNLNTLLASEKIANLYQRGSALIVRLAPYDYHRFHFPDTGKADIARYISGQYHSVNPIALAKIPGLFSLNRRAVTNFYSDNFGQIAYVEVGALTVGSIVQTYYPGRVYKGQEKGHFQYGGSTLVLLFEPGAIVFDDDLLQDSADNIEVQVFAGSPIGKQS